MKNMAAPIIITNAATAPITIPAMTPASNPLDSSPGASVLLEPSGVVSTVPVGVGCDVSMYKIVIK